MINLVLVRYHKSLTVATVIHEQMDDIQMAPVKFPILVETHWNTCVGPEIAFDAMDQMRLVEQDFSRWPFPTIVVPLIAQFNYYKDVKHTVYRNSWWADHSSER
jgi:hypothetical protein